MQSIALIFILSTLSSRVFAALPEVREIKPAEPVCVTSYNTELHRQPGAGSPVSWIVGKNMPFLKVGEALDKKKARWFLVKDLDGQKHWIRAKAVTNKFICVVVRINQSRLRDGPGEQAPEAELPLAEKYTPFRKIDREAEWVQIEDDQRGQYWIHESNLWIPASRNSVSF